MSFSAMNGRVAVTLPPVCLATKIVPEHFSA